MAEDQEEEVFYVQLRSHKEVKRDTLESMKVVLQSLEKFENFRNTRVEKNKAVYDLKRVLKEITALVTKLKQSLPKSNLNVETAPEDLVDKKIVSSVKNKEKEVNQEAKEEVKEDTSKKKPKSKKKKDVKNLPSSKIKKSDLDDLEKQLSEIESKLSNV